MFLGPLEQAKPWKTSGISGVHSFLKKLWKLFYNISYNQPIPKSGLNFLINKNFDKNYLLLCGFEKFREFFVRIYILEKLCIKIIALTKYRKFKIN